MTVRRAVPGEAHLLASMLADFNAEFETWAPASEALERRFATMLECDNVLILIADDPDPVGFALITLRPSAYYDGPVASLDELYVAPDRRGHGLGTQMMELLLQCMRDRCCGEVQINVDEEDRDARRFYETHGFTNLEQGSTERMLCYLREL